MIKELENRIKDIEGGRYFLNPFLELRKYEEQKLLVASSRDDEMRLREINSTIKGNDSSIKLDGSSFYWLAHGPNSDIVLNNLKGLFSSEKANIILAQEKLGCHQEVEASIYKETEKCRYIVLKSKAA